MKTTAPRAACLATTIILAVTGACRLDYAGGARPVNPSTLDAHWQQATTTPVVRQNDNMDCGLAALAMVVGAWGVQITLAELQRESPPTPTGVKLGTLRDLARERGLQAYAIRGSHADLARELAQRRPVLLGLLLPFEQNRALAHYEVAVAVDPKTGDIVTLDPASGKHLKRSRQVLDMEWKPSGYATLVVVGRTATARR
jgi:ABC-type bacteriocin/lantibiotic exporter with double-glycine peptidase domain